MISQGANQVNSFTIIYFPLSSEVGMGWDGQFADKAEKGELVIGVVGLGYVGLPTALGFYNSGFRIWGGGISQIHTANQFPNAT
jgi:hypothetical protein